MGKTDEMYSIPDGTQGILVTVREEYLCFFIIVFCLLFLFISLFASFALQTVHSRRYIFIGAVYLNKLT